MNINKLGYFLLMIIFVSLSSCTMKITAPDKPDIIVVREPSQGAVDFSQELTVMPPIQDMSGFTTGAIVTNTIGGLDFDMVYVAGGFIFPTGFSDNGSASVADAYWIAKTEVTYELWYKVYQWAVDPARGPNVYHFANVGAQGSNGVFGAPPIQPMAGQPVTKINQRDAMVWANAITEYYNAEHGTNYNCVCEIGGTPIRDSNTTVMCDNATPDPGRKGFRLFTGNEWELAARYKGSDSSNNAKELPVGSGIYWTPGNYVSGATDYAIDLSGNPNPNLDPTKATTWYGANSGGATHVVGSKNANALGLSDMSGNVTEWLFGNVQSNALARGGSWYYNIVYLPVGTLFYTNSLASSTIFGFRLAKTAD
ncbi:MAG: SUMF1/EgtB/PvdO family nonheme iron enzyme [Pseudomonadota bacterium]